MTLTDIKDLATVFAAVVGLGTLIKLVIEYTQQNKQKRADRVLEMLKRGREHEEIRIIIEALVHGDEEELKAIGYQAKEDFLAYYEEIALLMYSGLIRPSVTHYMFGYYAARCWESESFWKDLNRDSMYWVLFRRFALDMKKYEEGVGTKSLLPLYKDRGKYGRETNKREKRISL